MKNLDKTKIIIVLEIIRDIKIAILKINQKIYIHNFLEAERITFYYATVFFIKTRLFILMD